MVTKTKTIFNSDACEVDFEDARKDLAEYLEVAVEEVTDKQVWDSIYENINYWYETEQNMLDVELEGDIIAFGSVGRWDGSFSGYKVLGSNLKDILSYFNCDDVHVYYDRHGVHSVTYHHDGRNYMQFRLLRNDRNANLFLDKIYSGSVTDNDIKYYTKSLRPIIKNIYGW